MQVESLAMTHINQSLMDEESQETLSILSSASSSQGEKNKLEFFNDWERGVSGTIGKGDTRTVMNDFAIKLTGIVKASAHTGYLCLVKRENEQEERQCFFTATAINSKAKFIDQLNYSFGDGAMTCGFESNNHVAFFIQNLKRNSILKSLVAVTYSGLQPCGVYAMNSTCFINDDGNQVFDSQLTWIKREMFMESDKIVSEDIAANILVPLSTSSAVDFYFSFKKCLNHNFIPGLLVLAGAFMSFHYRAIISRHGGCSVTVASGPSGTGKSTSIKAALSLFGRETMFSKGTNAGMLERATKSTIPFGIDDPSKLCKSNQLDLGELCIDLYNGEKTINLRTGCCKPLSTAIIATNFEATTHPRVLSRILHIAFDEPSCGPVNADESRHFMSFMRQCSGGKFSSIVGWVISLKNKMEAGDERVFHFKEAIASNASQNKAFTPRNLNGWALCLFFLEQFLIMVQQECVKQDVEDEDHCVDVIGTLQDAMNWIIGHNVGERTSSQAPDGTHIFFNIMEQVCQLAESCQSETKKFMRLTHYDLRPCLALWVCKPSQLSEIIPQDFSVTVRRLSIGKNCLKRDFVGDSSCTVRRSCLGVYLDDSRWPQTLLNRLKSVTSTAKPKSKVQSIPAVKNKQESPLPVIANSPPTPRKSMQKPESPPPATVSSLSTTPHKATSPATPKPNKIGQKRVSRALEDNLSEVWAPIQKKRISKPPSRIC